MVGFFENAGKCNPASAGNKNEPCKYDPLDTNWCSTHICPDAVWHLPYGNIPLFPLSSGYWPFPRGHRVSLVALQLQICAAFKSGRWHFFFCMVVETKPILFMNSNQRGRIQSYYCRREQSQHIISIRQPISITANGIYASVLLSTLLNICTSFWPQKFFFPCIALKKKNTMQIKWMLR